MTTAPQPTSHMAAAIRRTRQVIEALSAADDAAVAELVGGLSRSQRLLAPLTLAVGGILMLFRGLRILIANWRLLLVALLPVAVTWLAMYDLKGHALSKHSLPDLNGPVLIPIGIGIVLITTLSMFMNVVFAFAVSAPGRPEVRPAVRQARRHLAVIVGSGALLGVMLAVAVTVISRERRPWFVLSLGIVTGLLMLSYVVIPARLVGAKPAATRRDKLIASIVAGVVGLVVAGPPYILGRVGVLMLGVRVLFVPGLVFVSIAVALEAGATVAVKSVKMTSKLAPGERRESAAEAAGPEVADG